MSVFWNNHTSGLASKMNKGSGQLIRVGEVEKWVWFAELTATF